MTVYSILFTAENADPPAIARHSVYQACHQPGQWRAGTAEHENNEFSYTCVPSAYSAYSAVK